MKLLKNTWSIILFFFFLVKTNGGCTMFVDANKKSGGYWLVGPNDPGHFIFYSFWNCLEYLISFSCFCNVKSKLEWGWMGRVYLGSPPAQGGETSHITKGRGPVSDN